MFYPILQSYRDHHSDEKNHDMGKNFKLFSIISHNTQIEGISFLYGYLTMQCHTGWRMIILIEQRYLNALMGSFGDHHYNCHTMYFHPETTEKLLFPHVSFCLRWYLLSIAVGTQYHIVMVFSPKNCKVVILSTDTRNT